MSLSIPTLLIPQALALPGMPLTSSPFPRPSSQVDSVERFLKVNEFLCKQLKRVSLVLYLNSAFSPSMSERIGVLYKAFATDGKLVVNYALTPAWG